MFFNYKENLTFNIYYILYLKYYIERIKFRVSTFSGKFENVGNLKSIKRSCTDSTMSL